MSVVRKSLCEFVKDILETKLLTSRVWLYLSLFISLIQKCFPIPYMICVNINHLLLDSLITNIDC